MAELAVAEPPAPPLRVDGPFGPAVIVGELAPSQVEWALGYIRDVLQDRHPEWFGRDPEKEDHARTLVRPAPALGHPGAPLVLHMVDAADPASPREVGASEQVVEPASPYETGASEQVGMLGAIAVMDGHACVRLWTGGGLAVAGDGLAVFDLGDPARPHLVGSLPEPREMADLAVAGQRAYLAADPGLVVVDLQNPAQPQQVGSIGAEGSPSALVVAGSYVCLASGSATANEQQATLSVIDVADPAQPHRVGEVTMPASILDLIMAGDHACLVTMQHRGDWGPGTATHALQIVDLTDPTRPRLAGSLPLPGRLGGTAGNLALAGAGNRVYLAIERELLAVDVSDPDAPQVAGSYAVGAEVHALRADGDHLYALSREGGLYILRLGE